MRMGEHTCERISFKQIPVAVASLLPSSRAAYASRCRSGVRKYDEDDDDWEGCIDLANTNSSPAASPSAMLATLAAFVGSSKYHTPNSATITFWGREKH